MMEDIHTASGRTWTPIFSKPEFLSRQTQVGGGQAQGGPDDGHPVEDDDSPLGRQGLAWAGHERLSEL
jgi:hypothetical protein